MVVWDEDMGIAVRGMEGRNGFIGWRLGVSWCRVEIGVRGLASRWGGAYTRKHGGNGNLKVWMVTWGTVSRGRGRNQSFGVSVSRHAHGSGVEW